MSAAWMGGVKGKSIVSVYFWTLHSGFTELFQRSVVSWKFYEKTLGNPHWNEISPDYLRLKILAHDVGEIEYCTLDTFPIYKRKIRDHFFIGRYGWIRWCWFLLSNQESRGQLNKKNENNYTLYPIKSYSQTLRILSRILEKCAILMFTNSALWILQTWWASTV